MNWRDFCDQQKTKQIITIALATGMGIGLTPINANASKNLIQSTFVNTRATTTNGTAAPQRTTWDESYNNFDYTDSKNGFSNTIGYNLSKKHQNTPTSISGRGLHSLLCQYIFKK